MPMQLKVIVDLSDLFIGYDAEKDWLYVDWKGVHHQKSSQAACELMLSSLRWPCYKILNDNSSITHTTMRLTAWSARWLDEMRLTGLQYLAWVLPPGLLARQSVETTVLAIDAPREGTFDDVVSAYVWLQQQHPRVSSCQ